MEARKDEQTDRGKTVYPPPPSGSGGIIKPIISTMNHKFKKKNIIFNKFIMILMYIL